MNIIIQEEKRAADALMIRGGNQSSSSNSNCRTKMSRIIIRTNSDSGTAINKEMEMLDKVDQKRGCRCRSSQLMKKANPRRGLQSMSTMARSATS
tara:strand:- start:83 stop:367 length:285 start_codon:yes stop_codon:yes gene_type:complete